MLLIDRRDIDFCATIAKNLGKNAGLPATEKVSIQATPDGLCHILLFVLVQLIGLTPRTHTQPPQ